MLLLVVAVGVAVLAVVAVGRGSCAAGDTAVAVTAAPGLGRPQLDGPPVGDPHYQI